MRQLKLIADNKLISEKDTQNPKLIGKKFEVSISEDSLNVELRSFFKWRKNCNYERFSKLGSVDYDKFIQHLFRLNY